MRCEPLAYLRGCSCFWPPLPSFALRTGGVCVVGGLQNVLFQARVYPRNPAWIKSLPGCCGDEGGLALGHLFRRVWGFGEKMLYYRETLLPH